MKKYFDAEESVDSIIYWIKEQFKKEQFKMKKGVSLEISNINTLVAAKLLTNALGNNKVFGIILTDSAKERDYLEKICREIIKIDCGYFDVSKSYKIIKYDFDTIINHFFCGKIDQKKAKVEAFDDLSNFLKVCCLNLISQSMNHCLIDSTSYSELFIGKSFSKMKDFFSMLLLSNYTHTEIIKIGLELKIPTEILSSVNNELDLGFKYEILDDYIRNKTCKETLIKEKIDNLHLSSNIKLDNLNLCPLFGLE